MTPVLTMSLSGGADDIAQAADIIDGLCLEHEVEPRVAFDLNLAIDELVTNILSYGFPGDQASPEVSLSLAFGDDGWVEAQVTDNGVAYNPFAEAPPPVLTGDVDERPIGGLGVFLVEKLMNEVAYRRDGERNVVTLRRHSGHPPSGVA